MADATHIEWTDATWNVVTGCSVVSPGCTNCYAMKLAGTRLRLHPSRAGLTVASKAGPVWTGEVRFNVNWLDQPLRWTRPRRIFLAAHGDLFHDGVTDDQLDQIFAVMALCPQHTFQVLTKRPERMRAYLTDPLARLRMMDALKIVLPEPTYRGDGQKQRHLADKERVRRRRAEAVNRLIASYLPNVWLGVSVEDQARADERIPLLLDTPAAIRWISAEPLLGPIDLTALPFPKSCDCPDHAPTLNVLTGDVYCGGCCEGPEATTSATIDWGVYGGESGANARPMHPDWVRQGRDQFADAGVPFLFKQWGAWAPTGNTVELAGGSVRPYVAWPDGQIAHGHAYDHGGPGVILREAGKKAGGRLLDGVLHDAYPEARS